MFSAKPIGEIIDFARHVDEGESRSLNLLEFHIGDISLSELSKFSLGIDTYNGLYLDEIRPDDECNILPSVEVLLEKNAKINLLVNATTNDLYGYYILYAYPPIPKNSLVSVFANPKDFEDTYYLFDIYINPEYRGAGFGKMLIEHIVESSNVHLHVREDNPAVYLYKKLGFVFLDRIVDYYAAGCTNALALLHCAD